jgi:Fe-S oxidoreductase
MASYKAEFLSHYYKGRIRPRAAYSMGLIFRWSRLAMWAPGLVNAALRAPLLGPALKWMAGFTQARPAPAFAEQSFQAWWKQRGPVPSEDSDRAPVILWPDTFNNYYLPGTLKAAVTVLEHAGFRVIVPQAHLCCGRPLYDYGMLDLARAKLEQVLDELRPAIREGIPVVGLEPSCVSVFRDEMLNLMPEDADARLLGAQTKTLSELLLDKDDWQPPRLERRAVLQTHCHHKSVLDESGARELLERIGVTVEEPAVGCCGHAGAFGYESEHYPVSRAIGEQALLPKVRETAPDVLVVADGFSCREQIEDGAERRTVHPVEVLALAIETEGEGTDPTAESRYREAPAEPSRAAVWTLAAVAGGVLAWGLAATLTHARR